MRPIIKTKYSQETVNKDAWGRINTLKCARLRFSKGKAYLMFRIPYEEAISVSTLQELQREGWKEYHSHCLQKDLLS